MSIDLYNAMKQVGEEKESRFAPRTGYIHRPSFENVQAPEEMRRVIDLRRTTDDEVDEYTFLKLGSYGLAGVAGVWLALSYAPEDQKILWGSLGGIGGLLCIPLVRWVIKRFV